MKTSFKVSTVLLANRELLYKAWLSSKEHSAFTGGKAGYRPKLVDDSLRETDILLVQPSYWSHIVASCSRGER